MCPVGFIIIFLHLRTLVPFTSPLPPLLQDGITFGRKTIRRRSILGQVRLFLSQNKLNPSLLIASRLVRAFFSLLLGLDLAASLVVSRLKVNLPKATENLQGMPASVRLLAIPTTLSPRTRSFSSFVALTGVIGWRRCESGRSHRATDDVHDNHDMAIRMIMTMPTVMVIRHFQGKARQAACYRSLFKFKYRF